MKIRLKTIEEIGERNFYYGIGVSTFGRLAGVEHKVDLIDKNEFGGSVYKISVPKTHWGLLIPEEFVAEVIKEDGDEE